jgi:hypothetical protein
MSPFAGGLRIIRWEVEMGNPRAVLVVMVILGWASAVNAQTVERRRVELGIGAGGAASWWVPSGVAGPEVRVSAPMGDRKTIEAIGGVSAVRVGGDTIGFYGVQMRQRLKRAEDGDVQPFVSYGVIGVFINSHSGYRYGSPSNTFVTPPFIGLIGGGAQRRVTSRLNARLEVQAVMALVVPVGVRVSAGVSVPVGKRR